MIQKGNKREWGLDVRKRIRRFVHMRENSNRLYHIGSCNPEIRIALVGTTDSAKLAPFKDFSWQIWGVGGRREWVVRADRWYEVHRLAGESEEWVENWREQAKLLTDTDIYMHYPEAGFGNMKPYPVEKIMQKYGTHFLTSSFAWMMAHAIDEIQEKGVAGEIGIWGIDMEAGSEYLQQREGLHHFIDLARVLGIKITRLASSGIAHEPIPYPMWQDDPLLNKLDKRQLHAREQMMNLDDSIALTKRLVAENMAVIASLDNPPKLKKIEAETRELNKTLETMKEDLLYWDGVESEQQFFRDYIT